MVFVKYLENLKTTYKIGEWRIWGLLIKKFSMSETRHHEWRHANLDNLALPNRECQIRPSPLYFRDVIIEYSSTQKLNFHHHYYKMAIRKVSSLILKSIIYLRSQKDTVGAQILNLFSIQMAERYYDNVDSYF